MSISTRSRSPVPDTRSLKEKRVGTYGWGAYAPPTPLSIPAFMGMSRNGWERMEHPPDLPCELLALNEPPPDTSLGGILPDASRARARVLISNP